MLTREISKAKIKKRYDGTDLLTKWTMISAFEGRFFVAVCRYEVRFKRGSAVAVCDADPLFGKRNGSG